MTARVRRLLPLLFCATLLGGFCQAQIEVRDDRGQQVSLERPAQRIISLAPSLTEMVFAVGAGDRLVGAIEYSDYPPPALEVPRVGRYDMLDMERILALAPDLILAWQSGNPRATVTRLQAMGLNVYVAEPRDLSSVADQLETIARLTGRSAEARGLVTGFREELAALRRAYGDATPVATFYQVWNDPLISVGGNELIHDIIGICGGRNVFGDLSGVAPKVSLEAVIERSPEAIIGSGADAARPEWLDDWRRWSSLPAVAADNLFFIPPELVQRHSPRALEGARLMCSQLETARTRLD